MPFQNNDDPIELPWWEILSEYPELGEGLEELSADPEAGIVAAVGIFTMLKLRFWHRRPEPVSDQLPKMEHLSDEEQPPGEGC
jgi:hypothetical protein